MSSQIQDALRKRFDKHRIIFWYDTHHEFRKEFEHLALPEVEKVEITNNEFALKYRLLREQPRQKFLLYKEGPEPEYLNNWLLDIQLSHDEFRTDQSSLWLAELELPIDYRDVVENHTAFFGATSRLTNLKKLLGERDSRQDIELKMMAVCTGSEARLDMILEALLQEHADQKEAKAKLLQRCNLEDSFWLRIERSYGYCSESPGIKDFVIELFKSCYAMGVDGEVRLSSEALVFLRRWRDNRNNKVAFDTLSAQCADVLQMEQKLQDQDFRDLLELDYFRLISNKIISDLARAVEERTATSGEISNWVRMRRQSFWYEEFKHIYEAIDHGARFIDLLSKADLAISSLSSGVEHYCDNGYKIDQAYRKFVWHNRQAKQVSLLQRLAEEIDNLYSNNYLLQVNNNWQHFVDATSQWDASPVNHQKRFYTERVMPFVRKDKKVCVIISDALRYEIGHELVSRIRQEDRFDADLAPALSVLPSFTQLGMAALLPHKTLELKEDGTVRVDGTSSKGTDNRDKILKAALPGKARAIQARNFITMNRDESRELTREHELIYLYHNIIDKTGDSRETQERVFDAAETAIEELLQLIKKMTNANITNLLITADHGFIYQNRRLEESDFADCEPDGEEVLYRDRRFVLGRGLKTHNSLKNWTATQLQLDGDLEVQIPKSINRLRLKGSGSQFVHGGASLQEVVIPVIQINKKRKSDISAVEVEILRGASTMITSGQLSVRLYQCDPVTDKVQPRLLRIGLYTKTGELVSDCKEIPFDMTSDQARDRELLIQLVLSHEADKANNQEVILRLDEKLAGTSHYQEYKSVNYQLRRSFTSDFDF